MSTVTSVQRFASITLLVPSYDEGIAYFVDKLSFIKTSDIPKGGGKRRVTVQPPNSDGLSLLLVVPEDDKQWAALGNQTGDKLSLFLYTDNFDEDYRRMKEKGVDFREEPRHEVYGDVVVFRDPWGNLYDFMCPATGERHKSKPTAF